MALQRHYQKNGVHASIKSIKISAKYLGLGITGGGNLTMVAIKEEINKAKPRNQKVSWLKKRNTKSRALYATGVYPQAVYGMGGVGYLPWAVRTLRISAADSGADAPSPL